MSNLSEYAGILNEIKQEIYTGRHKAILAANKELILHYWSIGNIIRRHQSAEGWGSKVIDKLAQDLASEFPGTKGFSSRNLKYMRDLPRNTLIYHLCKRCLHKSHGITSLP